jgi:hypothetical protein
LRELKSHFHSSPARTTEVSKVVRYRDLRSREHKLYFHYIIGQLALAFGFQDELSNIVSSFLCRRRRKKSAYFNSSAHVLGVLRAFPDVAGQHTESVPAE